MASKVNQDLSRCHQGRSHAGPELGPLASLMVAPEEGSWRVDEVTVSSSRSRHTDRFVCRDPLGSSGQSMGFLAPVPQDAVVYGSGESAVILTRVSVVADVLWSLKEHDMHAALGACCLQGHIDGALQMSSGQTPCCIMPARSYMRCALL